MKTYKQESKTLPHPKSGGKQAKADVEKIQKPVPGPTPKTNQGVDSEQKKNRAGEPEHNTLRPVPEKITLAQLNQIFPAANDDYLTKVADELNTDLAKYKLDTILRRAHFFAQVRQEAGSRLSPKDESLNYLPSVLIDKFSYYARHQAEAATDGRTEEVKEVEKIVKGKTVKKKIKVITKKADQQKIANKAYGNRNGNGSIESGDGWKYRGRGIFQLTAKTNYSNFDKEYKDYWSDTSPGFVDNPDKKEGKTIAELSCKGGWGGTSGDPESPSEFIEEKLGGSVSETQKYWTILSRTGCAVPYYRAAGRLPAGALRVRRHADAGRAPDLDPVPRKRPRIPATRAGCRRPEFPFRTRAGRRTRQRRARRQPAAGQTQGGILRQQGRRARHTWRQRPALPRRARHRHRRRHRRIQRPAPGAGQRGHHQQLGPGPAGSAIGRTEHQPRHRRIALAVDLRRQRRTPPCRQQRRRSAQPADAAGARAGQQTVRRPGRRAPPAAGHGFTLTQHEHYLDGDNAFTVLWVEHEARNNISPAMDGIGKLLGAAKAGLATLAQFAGSALENGTYRNRFACVSDTVAIVPRASAARFAGSALGPQTALVVGLPDAINTTTREHQVRIQFAWQRGASSNAGGLAHNTDQAGNAPGNDASGTWVRVAEALAGPNWGSQFTPRIGTEVLVDFIEGDMDRPLVVAQLYTGADAPPYAAGIDSGVNHAGVISGIHSNNFDGGGYNQWVQAPGSAQRGSYRGYGFELRTDAWGMVRSGEGLLISATARPQQGPGVASTQLDSAEAVGMLKSAAELNKVLADAATQHSALSSKPAGEAQIDFIAQIDPEQKGKFEGSVGGHEALKASEGKREPDPAAPVEKFAQPVVLMEAPASINWATPASTVMFTGGQMQWTTQADMHMAAAVTVASVSANATGLFTHAGGIKAIAANGPMSLQAHTDQLEILADKAITVISVNDVIEVKASQKIVLQAGQSTVTLEGGNITFACPGNFTVKGGSMCLMEGRVPRRQCQCSQKALCLYPPCTSTPAITMTSHSPARNTPSNWPTELFAKASWMDRAVQRFRMCRADRRNGHKRVKAVRQGIRVMSEINDPPAGWTLSQFRALCADVGSWTWGSVQGAFIEKASITQIIVDAVIGMIPLVGDATAVRDLIAVITGLSNDGENDTPSRIVIKVAKEAAVLTGAANVAHLRNGAKEVIEFLNRIGVKNAEKWLLALRIADHSAEIIGKFEYLIITIDKILLASQGKVKKLPSLSKTIDGLRAGLARALAKGNEMTPIAVQELDQQLREIQAYIRSGGETTSRLALHEVATGQKAATRAEERRLIEDGVLPARSSRGGFRENFASHDNFAEISENYKHEVDYPDMIFFRPTTQTHGVKVGQSYASGAWWGVGKAPRTAKEWREFAAVLNSFNGDGFYVTAKVGGSKGTKELVGKMGENFMNGMSTINKVSDRPTGLEFKFDSTGWTDANGTWGYISPPDASTTQTTRVATRERADSENKEGVIRLSTGDKRIFKFDEHGEFEMASRVMSHWIQMLQRISLGENALDPHTPMWPDFCEKLLTLASAWGECGPYILEPRYFEDPALVFYGPWLESELKTISFPQFLAEIPDPIEDMFVRTGEITLHSGIWEPVRIPKSSLLSLINGNPKPQPPFEIEGTMNYLHGGSKAPQVKVKSGAKSIIFDTTWRLIWRDERYKDGEIPEEEHRARGRPAERRQHHHARAPEVTVSAIKGEIYYDDDVTLHMEDRYNFSPGAVDVATGIPDAANGRFKITRLAKQYTNYTTVKRHARFGADSVIAVSLVFFLFGCDMSEEKQKVSKDLVAFRNMIALDIPIKTVTWEVFGTPEYNGGVPEPTDFLTLIAEIEPVSNEEFLNSDTGKSVWIAPESPRPWLEKEFRNLLEISKNSSFDISLKNNCRSISGTLKQTGKAVNGLADGASRHGAHEGPKAAASKMLKTSWQRCRVHFIRNAPVHAVDCQRQAVLAMIIQLHAGQCGGRQLSIAQRGRRSTAKIPNLAAMMDDAEQEVLTFMTFDKRIGRRSIVPICLSGSMPRSNEGQPSSIFPQLWRHHPPGRRHYA
uniref:Uncharacterized protein n=1 Tax=Tanacetum cinerariifolium TaxID=118510 RepID=A0A6L2N1Z0_TANCI|nr:hypothetical protein [Tanacetum cinerariifolium]